ncbi:Crp/Fnr family transcriptional regulator [Rubellimicrobium arenae]|uniref:Crp/Fnr family transcriptional regulator n=1 Tax=Rubellimicrobium arenae TaxID=2817372 RepID=UPI001B314986
MNRILEALPPEERGILGPHLETVPLLYREDLYVANSRVEHVWFIHRGVASLVTEMPEGADLEFATVGSEGMIGLPVFLGADQMASKAFIQVPGEGARIRAEDFRSVIGRCPELTRRLLRYTLALMNQMAQNASCNRTHEVEERCARWLLMTQDRVGEPSFPLTQEFLAQMLGVRRPTVSVAAGMLAKAGLISYQRGQMLILDREGLLGATCECYGIITGEFDRLVGAKG